MKLVGVVPVLLLIALAAAQNEVPEDKSETPRPTIGTSATEVPIKMTTTSKTTPPTTKPAPTASTTPPSTTTEGTTSAPTSSTPPSTTTSTTTASTPTTTVPTPTTTVPATTTTVPTPTTPKPHPKEYFWNVTNKDGINCILAKADITLKLTFTNGSKTESAQFTVPSNGSASGQCGDLVQILELPFGNSSTISFTFSRLNSTSEYRVSEINSTVSFGSGKNITLGSVPSAWFSIHSNTSYECSWSIPATLEENDAQKNTTKAHLQVEMRNVRLDAFRVDAGNEFSKADTCAVDTPDIVPIMVGIALGILVAVVLIAYLVGRRTTRAQGYLSM